jgi:hypothetical protein
MSEIPEFHPGGNPHLSLDDKLTRFPEGIALILPYGSKGQPVAGSPINKYMKGWEKRTLGETMLADYQHDLRTLRCNVAIRQGGGITRYVSFDFDTDDESVWREFFAANPGLAKTLITKGARGFNVWLAIRGDYPAAKKEINVRGEKVEWRGNGYVLIHGRHPSGVDYTVLADHEVVELEWSELVCPGPEWQNWPRLHEKNAQEKAHRPESIRQLSAWQAKKRRDFVDRNYEVLSWNEDYSKAHIECKNKDRHSTDTGDGQTVIFTGADKKGLVSYYCSHAHCREEVDGSSFNKAETALLYVGFMECETFMIHQQNELFSEMVQDLYGHLGSLDSFFRRSESMPFGIWHWRPGMPEPMTLSQSTMACELGEEDILFSKFNSKGKLVNCLAPKDIAKSILDAGAARALPIAKSMTKRALLVKTEEGARLVGTSYSPDLQTIILGKADELPEVSYESARGWLDELLGYWIWKEPADRSRALAELLTPALLTGGFITRPIPAMLMMADDYDAGKTFWHKTVSSIYAHELDPHAYGKNTIGGIEEQLQRDLERGEPFFFIDELDGTIKSTFINAFITGGDETQVRTAYGRFVKVSTEKIMIMLAGVKGFVIDPQLASRTIPIRILKPAQSANWMTPGGELLKSWIDRHREELISSVYTVIAQWDKAGSPMEAPDSRFPSWGMAVNGILKMLGLPLATEDLKELQDDVSNPASEWMNEMAKIMIEEGLLWTGEGKGTMINAAGLRGLCARAGLLVPLSAPTSGDDDRMYAQIRQLGKNLNRLPKAGLLDSKDPVFRIGSYYLIRHPGRKKSNGKDNFCYLLSSKMEFPVHCEEWIHVEALD